MKHKLLVAVDGEKGSGETAEYVARACAGTNQEGFGIVIFHVLPALPNYYGIAATSESDNVGQLATIFETETQKAATRLLAETKDRIIQHGVNPEYVTTEIAKERGQIAPQILQAAADHKCDTIVVGRRGRSMVGQFFLGSVVEHLLRNPVGFTIWVVE